MHLELIQAPLQYQIKLIVHLKNINKSFRQKFKKIICQFLCSEKCYYTYCEGINL